MATTSLFSALLLFRAICTVIHVRYVVFAGILRTVFGTVLSLIVLILSHNMYPFRNLYITVWTRFLTLNI